MLSYFREEKTSQWAKCFEIKKTYVFPYFYEKNVISTPTLSNFYKGKCLLSEKYFFLILGYLT